MSDLSGSVGGVRLLVFADVHLDAPFAWAGPSLARDRRRRLREAVTRVCGLAGTLRADALLCAGDLYEHDRVTPDTARFLRDSFDLGIPVFLAPGNHDWFGPTSLYAELDWSSRVHVFDQDRLAPVPLADGLTLWGGAHRAPANTDGFLDGFTVDRGGVHLALLHGSERSGISAQGSGKLPHAPFRAQDIPRTGLAHVFAGHFHRPVDGEWHTYPGNPDPLSFGETGERGAVLAEIGADGRVRRTRHPVAGSEVRSVTVDLTGIRHSGEIRERVGRAVAGFSGTVRVVLTGLVPPDLDVRLDDLAGVGEHLEALVPRLGDVRAAYDLEALAAEPTVRGRFVRDVLGDPALDEATRQRVLALGLRALDGSLTEMPGTAAG